MKNNTAKQQTNNTPPQHYAHVQAMLEHVCKQAYAQHYAKHAARVRVQAACAQH